MSMFCGTKILFDTEVYATISEGKEDGRYRARSDTAIVLD